MYLTKPLEEIWGLDIETESLTPKIIHCVCLVNLGTGEEVVLETLEEIKKYLNTLVVKGHVVCAHNGLRFDISVLNRLASCSIPLTQVFDTLIFSQVYNPSLPNGHSLESWGNRLRYPKIEFNDYSVYTPEMREYCLQDARLCAKIYLALRKKMLGYGQSERGLEIEHRSWWLIEKQRKNGFFFNKTEAEKLYIQLKNIERELRDEIYKQWPPKLLPVFKYKRAFKADGIPTKLYEGHLSRFPRIELASDGSYTAFDYVEFQLGSPQQRVEKLLELGWKPREPTKSGNSWKVTEKGELVPSLEEFLLENPDTPARALAEWLNINSRSSMLNTWLEAYNEETQCIHGNVFLADTLRYRHSSPNTANIPAVRLYPKGHSKEGQIQHGREGYFTYEARDLWACREPKTRRLVGIDAKGIQLRVLAHYLGNPEFTRQLLEGDPHEYNRELAGIRTRADAKTFIYAYLLGAGDAKIGQIIKGTPKEGREIKARFLENFPGLRELLERLQREISRTSRITLCDGTKLGVSSPHTALGYLLQGDESRIMKQAGIYVDEKVRKQKLDVLKVCDIHDETENDVLIEHVEPFTLINHQAFRDAGLSFNYTVPIECSVNVALTWAESH